MASNLDRMKKLEELQRRKQEIENKKASLAKAREANDGSIRQSTAETPTASVTESKLSFGDTKPKKIGPVIELKNFVGVFNMPPKQKSYMYDRATEVTKEQIRYVMEMQEEEKMPALNLKDDDKDKDEDFNKTKN